ncbi:MAG: hypothetical protein ACREV6_19580 [Clostridium sp.]|uniref:hypothetical protein n=1 Tax=Clostridium sp. TaxID=1506 RepID=UPI003D6C7DE8
MNKYQREKKKRLKKMAALGIGYSQQKLMLRSYNFEQIDQAIEQINLFKKSPLHEQLLITFKKLSIAIDSIFEKWNEVKR